MDAELHRVDRRLDVGRAGDRREHLAQDQVPRVVGERQDAPREARDGQVSPHVFVRVVVEVVLDGDVVELRRWTRPRGRRRRG